MGDTMPMDPKNDKLGKFDKYEVENALRTIIEAEELKQNTALMAEVKKLAGKKKDAISSIADLKEAASKLDDEEEPDESDDSEEPSDSEKD